MSQVTHVTNIIASSIGLDSSTKTNTVSKSQKTRSQGKKKQDLPSDQELNLTFLKRELAVAQARIVSQDAELSDKN